MTSQSMDATPALGSWPAGLPEAITQPGPKGWACFPQATVTFFLPPGETLVPVGETPERVPQAPTYDMPAEVRWRADVIEVCFGALPVVLRGQAFRPLQYELREFQPLDSFTVQASLSLGPCNQVLEGRYAERRAEFKDEEESMWFIRLGPRDDRGCAAPGTTLPDRMRQWYDEQYAATFPQA